jgi:hypothetical protein
MKINSILSPDLNVDIPLVTSACKPSCSMLIIDYYCRVDGFYLQNLVSPLDNDTDTLSFVEQTEDGINIWSYEDSYPKMYYKEYSSTRQLPSSFLGCNIFFRQISHPV